MRFLRFLLNETVFRVSVYSVVSRYIGGMREIRPTEEFSGDENVFCHCLGFKVPLKAAFL